MQLHVDSAGEHEQRTGQQLSAHDAIGRDGQPHDGRPHRSSVQHRTTRSSRASRTTTSIRCSPAAAPRWTPALMPASARCAAAMRTAVPGAEQDDRLGVPSELRPRVRPDAHRRVQGRLCAVDLSTPTRPTIRPTRHAVRSCRTRTSTTIANGQGLSTVTLTGYTSLGDSGFNVR